MPRKKFTVPVIFNNSTKATRATRTRRLVTDFRSESGDPREDGEIWLARIVLTRQARAQRRNGEKDWRRYYRWYEGEQWDDRGTQGSVSSDNPRDTATVNKTGSIINSIVPFLINDEIKFLLKPQRPGDDESAKIQQALLNYEWRERKMTRVMKSCALDMVTIGHCVAKTGYTVEIDESRKPNADGIINYADYIKQDAPWVERVNPLNFVFDLSAKDHTLHTARWCAEVLFLPYADVLSNKSYDKETLGMIRSGDASISTKAAWEHLGIDPRLMKATQTVTLPEDNLVALIEIWDKKYQKRMIYADGCPRPLLVEDWPYPYLDNFPYVMATYIEVPNQPYGLGLPRWIEDQQVQLNRAATLEQDVMRKSRPRHNASENTNPEEIQKFLNGDDLVIGDIRPIQAADLSQMFQVYRQNTEREIEQMSGADALLQGSRLPSRTTAGEIGTRARLTGLKLDKHAEDFEEFVEEIAVQELQHMKKFRTTADVIEITGDQNVGSYWEQYTNEDIQADMDVEVEYFAAPKTDPDLLRQQGLQAGQILVQAAPVLAQTAGITLNMPEVLKLMLSGFPNIGNPDRFFQAALPPPPTEGTPGMTPALGGMSAPGQVPESPGMGIPGEGLALADLMMGLNQGIQ